MEKEFIPYEQALALKELGFDDECFGFYSINNQHYDNGTLHVSTENMFSYNIQTQKQLEFCVSAPLYQQAFRWFREKHNLNSFVVDSKSYNWYFDINDMIKDDVISEILYFNSYEEAELECLKKLIEIVKTK